MKKNIFLGFFLIVVLAGFVSADFFEENYTALPAYSHAKAPNIQISKLKYEPYPVNPGEYVTVWIKAENLGTGYTQDLTFELLPKFPFSLDSDTAVKSFGKLGYGKQEEDEVVVVEYKVKVDEDATEGSNEIELRFNTDGGDSWFYRNFNIEVTEARTDFDLVIQEVDEQQVSIAIANTGKNIAYSVIVKMPEQENFEVVGTSGQMVGNLENGDYTMVSFEVKEKSRTPGKKPLKIQIDYTDTIGERRSLIKEVIYETGGMSMPSGVMGEEMSEEEREAMREQFAGRMGGRFPMMQTEKVIYQEWWFWAIILAVLFVGWKVFKKIKERKNKKKKR